MRKETGKWKSRWKIRDLLADERCSRAVLDFLTSTDVGRLVPPLEEGDAGREVSEWELRERQEREEEREAEAEELGATGELGDGRATAVPSHPIVHGVVRRGVGGGGDRCAFLVFSFGISFVVSLVRVISWWERPGRRANGERATCRHRADSGQENWAKCTPP